jgi:flagellar biosynthesis/type III secretory pathway protein FliH
MPEIGPLDEADFCRIDCKFRQDPKSLTTEEIGKLIERCRAENWEDLIDDRIEEEEMSREAGESLAYDEGYDEGYEEGHKYGLLEGKES